jgi:hypothetical protein
VHAQQPAQMHDAALHMHISCLIEQISLAIAPGLNTAALHNSQSLPDSF